MTVKTYEFFINGRMTNSSALNPSLASTASAATCYVDEFVINGVMQGAGINSFSATELATLVAAVKQGIVDALDLNTEVTAFTKDSAVGGGTGNGTVTGDSCAKGALAEVWTVTATSATAWTVTGATSGAKAGAVTGVPYNNGSIAFTINAGSTPFAATDAFTMTITQV